MRENERVLDVGCGSGRTYDLFKEKKVRYAGIDVSEALIKKATERAQDPNAEFTVGTILDLPVADGTFDAAVAVAVLHHIPSEAYRLKAMQELARSVKPGGYVLMTTWNLWQLRYAKMVLHQRWGKGNGWDFGDFRISWKKPFFPRYYHAFRKKELKKLVEDAGLQLVEQYYVKKGEIVGWMRGENLVTIARKNKTLNTRVIAPTF